MKKQIVLVLALFAFSTLACSFVSQVVSAGDSPIPDSTVSVESTVTAEIATSAPTEDWRAPVAYATNRDYIIRVDNSKWEIAKDIPDRSVTHNTLLTHRQISECKIGLVPSVEAGGPFQPEIVNIGNKNWEVTPFGYYLISNKEINFEIRTPIDNDSQSYSCKQDAYEILASLKLSSSAQPIVETPMPTYTPDVSLSGWRPCGGDYPVSYLQSNSQVFVSALNPNKQRIRKNAGRDKEIVGFALSGDSLTIQDAEPKCADGWVWWKVRVDKDGTLGWTAEGDASEHWIVPESMVMP